jgi:Tfp pilus assembly protein PilO
MARFIIALIGFSVSGAVFMFYTMPTYDSVRLMQGQIAEYDQALDRSNELQERKQTLLTRRNSFQEEDIERLHKLLPDHVDNVRLVLDFDNLASRHGLAIQNVVVGRGADDGALGKKAPSEVIGGGKKNFDSLTLKFSTHGSYKDFVAFMQDVESSLRIVDLVALNFAPISGNQEAEGVDVEYRFDVTIRTYWLK